MKKHNKSIFLFHRDLRLQDNTALIAALKESNEVIPLFIFEKKQIEKNPYKSIPAIQFMYESLQDLQTELQKKQASLHYGYGKTKDVIEHIINSTKIDAIYSNSDYTPFAKTRDKKLSNLCKKYHVSWKQHHDALLHAPGSVLKDNGEPYTVFTPFFKKAQNNHIKTPIRNTSKNYGALHMPGITTHIPITKPNDVTNTIIGGRSTAKRILRNISSYTKYKEQRDIPALDATSHLSAHHKFGTISARESYYKIAGTLGVKHTLITELHWRDFFTHIAYHFPQVFSGAFRKKYDNLPWSTNKTHFNAWCTGNTGFPIVDAGMRELNTTGFMHNRVRMITASFLVKDLHINWQWGEKYFAKHLVDYDPAVNNGNWQWAASTGCDAQPYFRIFNPWRQQERFDPTCLYIKKWVPELRSLTPKQIHKLMTHPQQITYSTPIVDHKTQSTLTKKMFIKLKTTE